MYSTFFFKNICFHDDAVKSNVEKLSLCVSCSSEPNCQCPNKQGLAADTHTKAHTHTDTQKGVSVCVGGAEPALADPGWQ